MSESSDAFVVLDQTRLIARNYQTALRKIQAQLRRVRSDWEQGNPDRAEERLLKARSLVTPFNHLAQGLDRALDETGRLLNRLDEQYDSILLERCHEMYPDWCISGSSKHYIINDLIDVKVDFGNRSTKVGSRRHRFIGIGLLLGALRKENDRLWHKPADPQKGIARLHAAYTSVLSTAARTPGEFVKLTQVKKELEAETGRMDRVKFGALLSAQFRAGHLTTSDGWRIHLAPTRSMIDMFPVSARPCTGREGYGLIRFLKDAAT